MDCSTSVSKKQAQAREEHTCRGVGASWYMPASRIRGDGSELICDTAVGPGMGEEEAILIVCHDDDNVRELCSGCQPSESIRSKAIHMLDLGRSMLDDQLFS